MAKTIIQTIGPLYGETVNGTVFGRPNGSIYVPSANTIKIEIPAGREYIRNRISTEIAICASDGTVIWTNAGKIHAVAESQDVANYILYEVSTDSDFGTILGTYQIVAGQFNNYNNYVASESDTPIVNGDTYYVRARLMSSSGVAVATSDVLTVTGVVVE